MAGMDLDQELYDYLLAVSLMESDLEEADDNPPPPSWDKPHVTAGQKRSALRDSSAEKRGKPTEKKSALSPVDPSWELIDPTPDIHALFIEFDREYFFGSLGSVSVSWSPRMTLCAGICSYRKHASCQIRLSLPLLKLRPRKDLVETLLHEMIHAYLFLHSNERESHGPLFHTHMNRINSQIGSNITVYHTFDQEVSVYKRHWWRCNGRCQTQKPFYGFVKRSMNRAPSKNDTWWASHQASCGGTFIKVREPKDENKKPTEVAKSHGADIRSFLPVKETSGAQANKSSGPQAKKTSGAQANKTGGQQANKTSGPQAKKTGGQQANKTGGPQANKSSGAQANKSSGPQANNTGGQQANKTSGSQANKTSGAQANKSSGPQANKSSGPQANKTSGPQANKTGGPLSKVARVEDQPDGNTNPILIEDGARFPGKGQTLGGSGRNRLLELYSSTDATTKPPSKTTKPPSLNTSKFPSSSITKTPNSNSRSSVAVISPAKTPFVSPPRQSDIRSFMSGSGNDDSSVRCPCCSIKVPVARINDHLDSCLS